MIDNKKVITGSFNWSPAAAHTNDETLLVIHSPKLAAHSPVRGTGSGVVLNLGSRRTCAESWKDNSSNAGVVWSESEPKTEDH